MLNSVLYVFGGCSKAEWTSKSWSLDLKPYLGKVSSSSLEDSDGTEISGMTSKCEPCAVVLGGRICVFSLSLSKNANNFELYNPKDGKWSVLPELPFTIPTPGLVKVRYYAVEKDDLFIHTIWGSYFITIDEQYVNGPSQWKPLEMPEVGIPDGYRFVKKGNLLILPNLEVVDIDKQDEYPYLEWNLENEKSLTSLSDKFIPGDQAIAGLLNKHGLRTCVFHVGGHGHEFYGNYDLLLKLSVVQFGERPCEGGNMVLNARLYELAHDFYGNLALVMGIFPLSTCEGLE